MFRLDSSILILGIIPILCLPASAQNVSRIHTLQVPDVCNMTLSAKLDGIGLHKTVNCACNLIHFEVDCSNLGIDEMPSLISFPKNVFIAGFENNNIKNIKNDTFYNGKEIIELDMSNNQIDFISEKAFHAFKKLKRLFLRHNRIWNLPANTFNGLNDLNILDLSYNDIILILPDMFQNLLQLKELYLQNNPLQEIEPKQFEHLSKLEILDLESTLLDTIPDYLFFFTSNLTTLLLSSNQLKEVPTAALKHLSRLKVLDISDNYMEVIPANSFVGLNSLVILYMDRMPNLERIENFAFGNLKSLQELHCSYNYQLYEIEENAFMDNRTKKKVALDQLFLRQNFLDRLPSALLNWSSYMELHLRGNPLHCDCETKWLIKLKLKNAFQDHVWCAEPAHVRQRMLSSLSEDDLVCGLSMSDIILISCVTAIGLAMMVMIAVFCVWKRSYAGYHKSYAYDDRQKEVDELEYDQGFSR